MSSFIYWKQGFDKSPYIVEKCVNSWIEKNKDFKIHLLDDHNIKDYIDIIKKVVLFDKDLLDE